MVEELRRNVDRIGAAERAARLRRAFPDAKVTGYQDLTATMTYDPTDRHIPAAAIRADAAVVVTFNIRDLPADCVGDVLDGLAKTVPRFAAAARAEF